MKKLLSWFTRWNKRRKMARRKEYIREGYKNFCQLCGRHYIAHMGSVAADPSDYCEWKPMTKKLAIAEIRRAKLK